MAGRFDPIDKITPIRECWRLKVRIVRLWYLPTFNNSSGINSIEMVMMDEFGSSIHASVRKTLIYKFKPLLSEGQVYVVSFFGVGNNTGFFRSTRHDLRLNFQIRTTVKPFESDVIPLYGFKFVSFEEIFQSEPDFPYLVDVIGVMTAVGTEKEYDKDGKKVKMIVIELESDGLKLEVALFGEFVDQISSFIGLGETQLPIIVIQYAKVKTFKGKIVLQNVMYGTRIIFNPDIPEAFSLRKSLPLSLDDNSQSLSIIPKSQYYSLEDDFLISTARRSIEELKDCRNDGFYVVLATVKGINDTQKWWYTACKCNKAVSLDLGMYYCDRCFCHVVYVVPRYRIKVRVMDDTDNATFVIWDRDGCRILGRSCSDLLEAADKNLEPSGFPKEFHEHLIEKSFLFKVEVKSAVTSHFETTFKVNRICNDELIIAKFKDSEKTFMAAERDMTIGLSLGDTSLSAEFQDFDSSTSKEISPLIDDNMSLGSKPNFNHPCNGNPFLTSVDGVHAPMDGDLSSTKLKKVKTEKI